jgi:hypothetical protein
MLTFATPRASHRKKRLFLCACYRQAWKLLEDERTRRAVDLAESFAEGGAEEQVLQAEFEALIAARNEVPFPQEWRAQTELTAALLLVDPRAGDRSRIVEASGAVSSLVFASEYTLPNRRRKRAVEHAVREASQCQCRLLRDVVQPFPARADPSWLMWTAGTVPELAQVAYFERQLPSGHLDPDRLAVLADALEEAGATGEIVAHLRGPGPHVRGCWAVDLLLGKD